MTLLPHRCAHAHSTNTNGGGGIPQGRVLWTSSALLLALSLGEYATGLIAGSRGLAADALHTLMDTLSVLPLAAAFWLERRSPTRIFPSGYGKVENLAGLLLVGLIAVSAAETAKAAIAGLLDPKAVAIPLLAGAAALGSIGVNLAVARLRQRAGEASGSLALMADAGHARGDALSAAGVLLGIVAGRAGFPRLDALVGLAITAMLLRLVVRNGQSLLIRLLDGVEPEVTARLTSAVLEVPGIAGVGEVRARWMGRRLHAEVNLSVPDHLDVASAHRLVREVRHRLLHRVDSLGSVMIHVDPAGENGEAFHSIASHAHDGLPAHSH